MSVERKQKSMKKINMNRLIYLLSKNYREIQTDNWPWLNEYNTICWS